ncbi:prolyl-tRNA editing enzyme YbaK/EbsC (Cys-tRNA(Pro) deacylase) [Neorhizobium galegae]|nr:prolyl-tRNA editing enzyme YbaK/EbsC (Cys-tRNA(Pro) deacylase) [Neorhizobium galegae]
MSAWLLCPLAGGIVLRQFEGMSLESVRAFFAANASDIHVIITAESSATVPLAAAAHGVAPEQIAKTICVRAGDIALLVVMSGTRRLDNRKFRDYFGAKPRMLGGDEVADITGHPIGGVCPFGLSSPMPIYCDVSLRKFEAVVPAAGAINAAVRISPDRMADLTAATWVDVGQDSV